MCNAHVFHLQVDTDQYDHDPHCNPCKKKKEKGVSRLLQFARELYHLRVKI
jgi:hypothetical protein